MTGEGKWKIHINMLIYKGDIEIVISDDDGKCKVDFIMPEKLSGIKVNVTDVKVQENELSGSGVLDMGRGRTMPAEAKVKIDGDTMSGTLSLPKLKRQIPLTDGRKISD